MHVVARIAGLAVAFVFFTGSLAAAQSVTLAWDPNPEPDVAGYRLHYGTTSKTYSIHVDVGKKTTHVVTGLDLSKNYYFAVQAYTSSGLSSPMSAEVTQPALVTPGTTTIASFKADAAYPLLTGVPVTWTAAATSKAGRVEYKFLLYSATSGWTVAQDFSPLASFTWTPTVAEVGVHSLQVWVRTIGSLAPYEAWVGTPQFEVTAAPVRLTADMEFPVAPRQPVKWTAAIAGADSSLEYRFLLYTAATGRWTDLRAYGASNEFTWTPQSAGTYNIQVWARRAGSTASYEMWGGTPALSVAASALEITSLTPNRAMPAVTGTPITWTARARGGTAGPIQYQFYRYSVEKNAWQMVQNFSASNTYTWTPSWGDEGNYVIQVWARNAGSSATYDAWLGTNPFELQRAPIELTTTTAFPAPPGTAVRWTASVSNPSAQVEYQFFVYSQATGTWAVARPYSTTASFTWTPAAAGTYLVQVWARRIGSTAAYDQWRGSEYLEVKSSPAGIHSLTSSTSSPRVGTPVTWTAIGKGGSASPLQYAFYLYREGTGWTMLRGYGTSNTFTWTPTSSDVGTYLVQVWVRSNGSTATYEGWAGTPYFIVRP
jgi:hypothetical protein